MPFQSQKQAAYLKYNEPEVFNRWKAEAHAKKKGSRVSKSQQRYGGAGTRGRRITDDDSPLGEVAKADWMNISEHERRGKRARRRRDIGVATAFGSAGALGSLDAFNRTGHLRDSTGGQMVEMGRKVKQAHQLHRIDSKLFPQGASNRALASNYKTIIRQHPRAAVAYGLTGAMAGGTGLAGVSHLQMRHHEDAISRQRKARARAQQAKQEVAAKRFDYRTGSEKTSDRARSAAEFGGAVTLAAGATKAGRKEAKEIVRNTRNDTRVIRGRPVMERAKLRGLHSLVDVMARPKGAALLGGAGLMAGAIPVAVVSGAKANSELYKGERFPLPPAGDWLKTTRQKAAYDRMARRRARVNPRAQSEDVGKRSRYYDPEHKRQRRIGAGEAVLVVGGGGLVGEGTRRAYGDTKKLRAIPILNRGGTFGAKLGESEHGKGAIRVGKVPAALIAGGTGALAGASLLHRHAGSNRGAPYN